MTLPVDHLSYSSINTFRYCPISWRKHYIDRVPRSWPGWLYLGGEVHEATRFNYEQKIDSRTDLSIAEVVSHYSDHFDEMDLREGTTGIDWKGNTPEFMKDLGVLLIEKYMVDVAPSVQPVAVELAWSRDLCGVSFIGFIDVVDDKGVVIEEKTKKSKPRKDSWHKELQPTFYAFGLGGPTAFDYHYMIKTIPPRIEIHRTYRDEKDIAWLKMLVPPIIRSIEEGIFIPTNIDWKCTERYCDYWEECKERRVR